MWVRVLEKQTNQKLDCWNQLVRETPITDENELRTWLTDRGVTGYAQTLLVMERFGYPDFLTATADELAGLFNNATYGAEFAAFSPLRLFTPVGSNITEAFFFVPGSQGTVKATVSGFGVVFTDVDQPDGSGPGRKHGNRGASTLVEYFDVNGNLLYSSFAPAAPGQKSLSFLGIKFADARIAAVRITTGDSTLGPDDDDKHDIVMMDDFIYGEPQPLP